MAYSQKYTIVQFFQPTQEGESFSMTQWPLHITLADVFAVDVTSRLLDDLQGCLGSAAQIRTRIIGEDMLGTTNVWLVENTPALYAFHAAIITILEKHGATFNTPEFTKKGFLPHITKQPDTNMKLNDKIEISMFSLVDMFPDGDWQQRTVLKHFRPERALPHEALALDPHLRLVQLRPDQADILFALTDNNREYLGEFLPWVPYVKTVDDSRKHIEETIESRQQETKYTYGIELNGQIIGDISLRNMNDASRTPEIGYWIAPEHAGKGLTTRAVKVLTDFGLHTLGLRTIIIRANPANIASNKVAEKSGYRLTGHEVENDEPLNVWSITQ